jgi:hypothetical protein
MSDAPVVAPSEAPSEAPSVEVVPVPVAAPAPAADPLVAELTALFAGILKQKPSTAAEALALFEKLDLELVKWLVSDMPADEQKTVMAAKWAVKEVVAVAEVAVAAASAWCVPSTPKKPVTAKAESA